MDRVDNWRIGRLAHGLGALRAQVAEALNRAE
jgi:hypothetical protein